MSAMASFRDALRTAPPTAIIGMVVVLLYIIVTIFAPALAPYGERDLVGGAYEPWSSDFLLGTDALGRDMLSRMLYGARNTVSIALLATILAFVTGIFFGLLAATLGGWVDQVLSWIVEFLISIPSLILMLLLLSVFGTSIVSLVLIIALVDSTRVFRVARSVAFGVAAMEFVEVAVLRGENLLWIIRREILPNCAAPLLAEFGLRFSFVFLTIAALSFLGLGLQPPLADWGSMVRDNASLISFGDITPLLPAAAIGILAVSVNFLVDWMLQRSSGLKD
jgi:peptide/nickel transport system permease protein